jgi:hypothetical protein
MITFERAKLNLLNSMNDVAKLRLPFLDTDEDADRAVRRAIVCAKTWTELGVAGNQISQNFGFLQKPIVPLETYTTTIPMQFDTGRVGWYFLYGMSSDGGTGFLLNVFRYPTTPFATAADTYYCVFGYVVTDFETKPFSMYGYPIYAPGVFTHDVENDVVTLDIQCAEDDANIYLRSVHICLDASSAKRVCADIAFKNKQQHGYVFTSAQSGFLEGEKGCVPCVEGAGTNYWSLTYLQGRDATDAHLVGWFDHQWVSSSVRSTPLRAVLSIKNTFYAEPQVAWMWLTLQVTPNLQYMVATQLTSEASIARLLAHAPIQANAVRFLNGVPTYNVPATIEVLETWKGTAATPSKVRVTIKNATAYVLQTFIDGRVTLGNGGINQEAIAVLFNAAETERIGTGFIEGNNLHTPRETMTRMMRLANIDAPVETFLPKRTSAAASAAAFTFVIAILLVVCAFVFVLVYAIGSRKK